MNAATTTEIVGARLEHYARRGVLRAYSGARPAKRDDASYSFVWFHGRTYELVSSRRNSTVRIPVLLPSVPARSRMYREFRRFLASKQNAQTPEHRRIDPLRCRLVAKNRKGNVELAVEVLDGDFDHGTRSLVHVVNEVFLVFLRDGVYRDYMMDVWELDPDSDRF